MSPKAAPASAVVREWQDLLRAFKENLARRLWAVPTMSEAEKELVYKEYLSDLTDFETAVMRFQEEVSAKERVESDENELLRGLLGVPHDELRTRALALNHDLEAGKREISDKKDEVDALTKKMQQAEEENEFLRRRILEAEKKSETLRFEHERVRMDDIRYFSETNDSLKNELKSLESRLANLRELFAQTNQALVREKQDEITGLQRKLLDEMESALRRRQELSWTEEEMFAKGVAHKVRAALVSAQGQLFLTLERLGLLDPETKSEATWKARFKLFIEGGSELAENFKRVQAQFAEITHTLDDYLHLTGRKDVGTGTVMLKDIVKAVMADLFADRRPTLNVEFLSDDPFPGITGDAEMLRFVVRALLQNAVEALPSGTGKIEVALKNESARGRVQLLIRDTGKGIPANVLPRLFQPFLSTKDGRQGLNLSRVKRYVELHGGKIELVTTGAQGTTFMVELPLDRTKLCLE